MADFPALPIWTDAYLADTIHLTPEQHGIYYLLLLHTWRTPGCKIPDDDEWLAGRFRMPVEWVREKVRPVLKEFYALHGVCMMQKRLSAEYAYVTAKRKKRVDAANRRWSNRKEAHNASSNASCNAYAPTPTPFKKERKRETGGQVDLAGETEPLFSEHELASAKLAYPLVRLDEEIPRLVRWAKDHWPTLAEQRQKVMASLANKQSSLAGAPKDVADRDKPIEISASLANSRLARA